MTVANAGIPWRELTRARPTQTRYFSDPIFVSVHRSFDSGTHRIFSGKLVSPIESAAAERDNGLLRFIGMPHQSRNLASVFLWCSSRRLFSSPRVILAIVWLGPTFSTRCRCDGKKRATHPSPIEIVKCRPAMEKANEAIGIEKNRGIEIKSRFFFF